MTVDSYPFAVLVSFVLRLRADQLADGRLVGEVEEVGSGRTCFVRSGAELAQFCADFEGGPGTDERADR